MQEHEHYMRRCLELAQLGAGKVSPNPMVGALLVHEGKIISENYHQHFGGPHAEVLVVEEVRKKYSDRAAEVLRASTLYVSLEPCAHQGKTPPCATMIVENGIRKVVVACRDPFDQVNGQGIAILQQAGVEVTEGVLEKEAQWVNRRFITRVTRQRPYIILKWAQTADGYMAAQEDKQQWITGAEAKQLVHRWRSEEDAVLVGAKTAVVDDPQLTTREWLGKHPKRILVDKNLIVPETARLFDNAAETIVFNAIKSDWKDNIKQIALENFDQYLPQNIAFQLYLMDVQSVIVEGGRKTLGLFIDAGLWDEARVLVSPDTWGTGVAAPVLHYKSMQTKPVGRDRLNVIYREP